jgi:hypothetical protein
VFDAYYREREEAITTLSAYDLAHLPTFSERFDRLLARLEPALPQLWPVVSRSIFFAEGYAPRTELQRSNEALASIDLLDAFRRIELNAPAFPAAPSSGRSSRPSSACSSPTRPAPCGA